MSLRLYYNVLFIPIGKIFFYCIEQVNKFMIYLDL